MITADTNSLILIIGGIIGVYILLKVASKVLRIIGILIVVALGFYLWKGGSVEGLRNEGLHMYFGNSRIEDLEANFCNGDKADNFKCECVIKPVYQDLTTRLTPKQIAEIDQNPDERIDQIRVSLGNKKDEITDCGMAKNKPMMEKALAIFKAAGVKIKEGLENADGKPNE